MAADPHDVILLVKTIDSDLPHGWRSRPGSGTGQIELALIEAVLSVRARGRKLDAVRASVARWRTERDSRRVDDVHRLAVTSPTHLATITQNREILPGGLPMCWAITQAARNLAYAGIRRAADLAHPSPAHRRAFTAVPGLGPTTWAHFLMLLGVHAAPADGRTVRFVRHSLGRTATPTEARELLAEAATELGVSAPALSRALWRHVRGYPRVQGSKPSRPGVVALQSPGHSRSANAARRSSDA